MKEQLKLGNLRLAVENDDCALLENLLHEEEVDVNYTFRLKTNRFGVCVCVRDLRLLQGQRKSLLQGRSPGYRG